MFPYQFIDWVEDATCAISILIEQNGMWACDVGDCMWLLLPYIQNKGMLPVLPFGDGKIMIILQPDSLTVTFPTK